MWEVISKQHINWLELEALQQELIQRVKANPKESYLLLSEPAPTFTHGKTAQTQDLLWSNLDCKKKGVTVASVSRGGQWTYHGPGQILCYPIVNLEYLDFSKKDAKQFVEVLRNAVLSACSVWEIPAIASDSPFGVFVKDKKLASFGLSFSEGVSSHGLALYLTPQEDYFSGIHACGNKDTLFTCLTDFQPHLTWHCAAQSLVEFIKKGFKKA